MNQRHTGKQFTLLGQQVSVFHYPIIKSLIIRKYLSLFLIHKKSIEHKPKLY